VQEGGTTFEKIILGISQSTHGGTTTTFARNPRVAVGKAEDLGDVVGVNQVVNEDAARHEKETTPVTRRQQHL
jgi:hypothetical protein